MFRPWFVLILLISALEIWGMIVVGKMIGGFNTLLILILIGVLGAYVAKSQGRLAWQNFNDQLRQGVPPGQSFLDGISILIGGFLLVLPGFFTDIIGVLLLLPPTRKIFKYYLLEWIKKKIESGSIYFNGRRW